jgi:hypothetical protein
MVVIMETALGNSQLVNIFHKYTIHHLACYEVEVMCYKFPYA